MADIKIKKLNKIALIPKRMTKYSAGYDIYSANEKDIVLGAGKSELIPTGFALEIPIGLEAQIRPRSGLAAKHQIGILNSPGTIDADYRGEVKVILYNFGQNDFIIEPNMRIAQMVISKLTFCTFLETEELGESARGKNGFGHTKL